MKRGLSVFVLVILMGTGFFSGLGVAAETGGMHGGGGNALPGEPGMSESDSKISFHGYGELHYNNPEGGGLPDEDEPATLDFHRLVLGWSYYYNDQLSLHAEIDYEHAAQELELEFAYIDYVVSDAIGIRVGNVLIPVGPLNEFHEPTLFYSVERPYVQRYIIPTTWNSGGFGFFGQPIQGVHYRIYFIEGLDASGFSEDGIRGGRQILSEDENKAVNFGGVGRLEYTGVPGLAIGASLYSAGAGQGTPGLGGARVTLWDVDVRYRIAGFDLAALYAQSSIDGAEDISAVVGETVGEEQEGWYAEVAYHLSSLTQSEWDWVPFVRFEQFDTQSAVPSGFTENPATDRQVITFGLAFYPHPDVALKVDREMWEDEADGDGNRTNAALAFIF
ncbi:MAG: hypothetical protein MPW16_08065 [Candidatus Manganitrophus sp.]|nr:MAG: hypothetical protein MPW16_08065 [Candidatus Manganitrophus sp.]